MNLAESLGALRDLISYKEKPIVVVEDKGHIDHPEDLVFLGGSQGAQRAVQATIDTVKNPTKVTIKWDGYPALLFGAGTDGKFIVVDKHMMNKTGGAGRRIYSPEQFIQYDQQRGVERTQLAQLIPLIWPGLQKAYSGKGFYWGDLIFSQPLELQNDGLYHFRANPNGISYTVDANSEVGKLIAGKQAGIAVHQYLDPDAPEKAEQMSRPGKKVVPTDLAKSLNGTIGNLKNNSDVAIVPAKMPITPKLKLSNNLVKNANAKIKQYGAAVDQLFDTAPQARDTFNQHFTTYINKKIVAGDLSDLLPGFMEYVQTRPMTDSMRNKISAHLQENQAGLKGAFEIWAALYTLKLSVVEQLNNAAESSPVKGYLQNGTQTQEGFVSHGLKFVDRMGFSRQNLAGRT